MQVVVPVLRALEYVAIDCLGEARVDTGRGTRMHDNIPSYHFRRESLSLGLAIFHAHARTPCHT